MRIASFGLALLALVSGVVLGNYFANDKTPRTTAEWFAVMALGCVFSGSLAVLAQVLTK